MAKQLKLNIYRGKWGGRRPSCGRKRIHSRGVAHRPREKITSRLPIHVTIKYRLTIRTKEALRILKRAIVNSRKKGLKILHYSLQSNHLHLILEAMDNKTLTSGMRSLTVTLARGFKQGKVQLKRYHLHVLKTTNETKNAIRYVLFNEQRHTKAKQVRMNSYSSLSMIKDVRRLVQKEKMTLIMSKEHGIPIDPLTSFFSKRAWAQLIN